MNHCSDETTAVNHSGMITQIASNECDSYGWRRPRSESSADAESMYMTNPVLSDSGFAQQSRRSSVSNIHLKCITQSTIASSSSSPTIIHCYHHYCTIPNMYYYYFIFVCIQTATAGGGGGGGPPGSHKCYGGIKEWCIAWWHSGREDSDDYGYEAEEPSDLGYATPVSIETPIQSSVSR